jgi:hypothetical protein
MESRQINGNPWEYYTGTESHLVFGVRRISRGLRTFLLTFLVARPSPFFIFILPFSFLFIYLWGRCRHLLTFETKEIQEPLNLFSRRRLWVAVVVLFRVAQSFPPFLLKKKIIKSNQLFMVMSGQLLSKGVVTGHNVTLPKIEIMKRIFFFKKLNLFFFGRSSCSTRSCVDDEDANNVWPIIQEIGFAGQGTDPATV